MTNKKLLGIITTVVVIVILVIAWKYYSDNKAMQEQLEQAAALEAAQSMQEPVIEPSYEPEPVSEPETPIDLPEPIIPPPVSLQNSDPQVQMAIADIAPELSKWLVPDEQIRKWVLTVDMMADGTLPKRYRPIDFPMSSFSIDEKDSVKLVSESNFDRLNEIINTATRIEPTVLARYYKEWLPTLEKAYAEQGKKGSFDQRLRQTMSQILAAEPLDQTPVLIRPKVLYQYADVKLEAASDIEKLLWRMGPENSEQLQNFVRELRNALDQD